MKKISSTAPDTNALIQRVRRTIYEGNLLARGDRIIVAVSGGADSFALLDILQKLNLQLELIAVYIDHGLRPSEVTNEIKQLKTYCDKYDIVFLTKAISVANLASDEKRSIEDAARILRYEAIQNLCTTYSATVISTGHTADDQVEEFFIRLIRGSSIRGLSGMRLKRDNIIRPLLREQKQTLIRYLKENSIVWCTDSSNEDRKYLRNRIRHDLLPFLQNQFNPSMRKTVLQCMDILASEDGYLQEVSANIYSDVVTTSGDSGLQLDGPSVLSLHLAIQRRIIEECCWKIGVRPSYQHINKILDLLIKSANNSELHLKNNIRIKKMNHNLLFVQEKKSSNDSREKFPDIDLEIPAPGKYEFEDLRKKLIIRQLNRSDCRVIFNRGTLYADMAAVTFPLRVRSVQPGDRFHPYRAPGHKKISRFFNDKKIPPTDRPTFPLLVGDHGIIALLGLQIDNNYKISASTTRLLELTWDNSIT